MIIIVNGVTKELEAIGKNGIEWTNDLLGMYGALHYDNEQEQYAMTEEDFEWWESVVDMLNEISCLEDELDEDAREEYEVEYWPSDLDDEARARLEWLKNKIEIDDEAHVPEKYHIIDLSARNAREELREYTFEELKNFFEPDKEELPEDWKAWAQVQDLFDLEEFLEVEADGMEVHFKFEKVAR